MNIDEMLAAGREAYKQRCMRPPTEKQIIDQTNRILKLIGLDPIGQTQEKDNDMFAQGEE